MATSLGKPKQLVQANLFAFEDHIPHMYVVSIYSRVLHLDIVMRFPQILRPFRLLRQDLHNLRFRYLSDWTVFNQLIIASAVYVFFTNLLPGITFASDLYVLTGKSWGTVEVVFSTGLCGVIFSLYVLME